MKITDKLGRSLAVDVVVKASLIDMWMEPLGYNLDNSDWQFLRLSNGPFALRVMSRLGADVRVHLNGQLLLDTKVLSGIQYLECDRQGQPFLFGIHSDEPTERSGGAPQSAPAIPAGEGVLFVVVRFADDPIYGSNQPPPEELAATFQLRAPEEHDRSLAGSLSRLVQPELPDQADAVVDVSASSRPSFVCSCTGCRTGKSHSH